MHTPDSQKLIFCCTSYPIVACHLGEFGVMILIIVALLRWLMDFHQTIERGFLREPR
jgi:hypothetical protein